MENASRAVLLLKAVTLQVQARKGLRPHDSADFWFLIQVDHERT